VPQPPASVPDSTLMSLQGLEGRVAFVTGAASGIGRRVAETLVALGMRVAASDLREPDVPQALPIVHDVTEPRSTAAAISRAESELGPLAALVTCAGIFESFPLEELDSERWQRTIDVNLTGTFECVRSVVPAMRSRGHGRIVTLSSMAGVDGGAEACAHYAASKGAVIAFTKAVSKECCADGVTANVVAPRAIRTPMIAGLEEELVPQIPVGRLGEPDDVAALVAFLCSGHASYITGEVIMLTGGWW
jgi:NAD(P)-dependent dehydrogenase (short-subunit alcohol dehydrogenase family)